MYIHVSTEEENLLANEKQDKESFPSSKVHNHIVVYHNMVCFKIDGIFFFED